MGSFDFTCSLSGLGIRAGDPVKYFLLTDNPYEDTQTVCSPHAAQASWLETLAGVAELRAKEQAEEQ